MFGSCTVWVHVCKRKSKPPFSASGGSLHKLRCLFPEENIIGCLTVTGGGARGNGPQLVQVELWCSFDWPLTLRKCSKLSFHEIVGVMDSVFWILKRVLEMGFSVS